MTYTTESDIEAMAEAIHDCRLPSCGTGAAIIRMPYKALPEYNKQNFRADAKAALAASPVHAELERVKAENERLRAQPTYYQGVLWALVHLKLHDVATIAAEVAESVGIPELIHAAQETESEQDWEAIEWLLPEMDESDQSMIKQALQQKGGGDAT